jgi:hypothetical protein
MAALIVLHGGWDSILMALAFWAVVFASPFVVGDFLILWLAKWRRRKTTSFSL